MQRRSHPPPLPVRDGKTEAPRSSAASHRGRSIAKEPNGSSSVLWLCLAFCLLSVMIYLFPENRKMAYEQRLEQVAYDAEQRLEHDLIDWWGQKPPLRASEDAAQLREAANARMRNQGSSSWVEGEQKLKQALKVLVARQAAGMDLGVPVLTRWLGDDVPAFSNENDVAEWNRIVEQKYAAMRKEEEQWRERIAATLATNAG